MAASVSIMQEAKRHEALAPWWHTLIILALFLGASVVSAQQNGLEHFNILGLSVRLSSYLTVMAEEWFAVALIWLTLRKRGLRLLDLIGGRWNSAATVGTDAGLAFGTFIVFIVLGGVLTVAVKGVQAKPNPADLAGIPRTPIELLFFLGMAITAGFCEELVFRGYLQRQFSAWTGSVAGAVLIQAVLFGICHGYKDRLGMVIAIIYGGILGGLALWRRSLRPGMLAHGWVDSFGGIVGYLITKG